MVKLLGACICVMSLLSVAGGRPAMVGQLKLSLLFFEGCPNSPKLMSNLKAALKTLHLVDKVERVDILKLPNSDARRGYGSPTVLVNGRELFGLAEPKPNGAAPSCRLYEGGVPSAGDIAKRLKALPRPGHS